MKYSIFIGLAVTILVGCINSPETDKTYTLSFPLDVGHKWEYESIVTYNDTFGYSRHIYTSITSADTNPSGFPVFEFKDSTDEIQNRSASYDYYEKRPDGLFIYASTPGGSHALWKSTEFQPGVQQNEAPVLLAPTTFKPGDEWTYDTIERNNERIALKRIFLGMEKVISKSGNFDCYKFETTGYMNEKRYHYYYPNIGLVKKVQIVDSLEITDANYNIIGYRRYVEQTTLVSTN
jgi:hypothetical protein